MTHDTSQHTFSSCCSWCITWQHIMAALRGKRPEEIYPHTSAHRCIWWVSATLLIDSREKVCRSSNPENTVQFCSLQTCDLPKTGQKPHHYKFLRCESRKALLLASCDEPHLVGVCAVGAISHHALRTWPTSDTINSLHTSHSRVAGIGITGCFLIWDVCAHAYNNNNNNNMMSHYILTVLSLKENIKLFERSN